MQELEVCKSELVRERTAANRERAKSQRSRRKGDLDEVKIRMRQVLNIEVMGVKFLFPV